MIIDLHYNTWFYIAVLRQFTCLYETLMPHTYFSKPQVTFEDVHGNTALTLWGELW